MKQQSKKGERYRNKWKWNFTCLFRLKLWDSSFFFTSGAELDGVPLLRCWHTFLIIYLCFSSCCRCSTAADVYVSVCFFLNMQISFSLLRFLFDRFLCGCSLLGAANYLIYWAFIVVLVATIVLVCFVTCIVVVFLSSLFI